MESPLAVIPAGYAVAFAFALGASVGSFVNVVIHRLPRDESIVRPRSRCPACRAPIPAWANVPLVSYALLRGRCRSCGARISARYPLVEALTGALFVALLWTDASLVRLLAHWGLAAALVAVAFIDLDHHVIPNQITYPGMALGAALALLAPPPHWLDAVAGFAVGGGLLWALAAGYQRLRGRIGLGFGDVKLVAMLGTFLGLDATLGTLVLGSVIGLVYGAAQLAIRGGGRDTPIPFGPALALAGLVHLFQPRLLSPLLGGA